jgi:anti-sigma factor RsiW
MIEDPPFEPDRALAMRWRRARSGPIAPEPMAAVPLDPSLLAAYVEGRLSEAESLPVEMALAADPALLDTLIALRQPAIPAIPSAALIRSAQALVAGAADPVVVPFARRSAERRGFKAWVAWGAVAASLLIVSTAGFSLGMSTGGVADTPPGLESPSDLLDLSILAGDDVG